MKLLAIIVLILLALPVQAKVVENIAFRLEIQDETEFCLFSECESDAKAIDGNFTYKLAVPPIITINTQNIAQAVSLSKQSGTPQFSNLRIEFRVNKTKELQVSTGQTCNPYNASTFIPGTPNGTTIINTISNCTQNFVLLNSTIWEYKKLSDVQGMTFEKDIPVQFKIKANVAPNQFISGTLLSGIKIGVTNYTLSIDPPWWDTTFTRRRGLNITNNNATVLLVMGHPISFTFDTATEITQSDMRSDCQDVRIVYNNVSEISNVNMTGCNTATTRFIFNLTNTSIAATTGLIDLYYGKSGATRTWTINLTTSNSTKPYSNNTQRAMLDFNECTGTTAPQSVDQSGNGNNMTTFTSLIWNSTSIFDCGITGDASTDIGSVPNNANLQIEYNRNWTVEFWLWHNSRSASTGFIEKADSTNFEYSFFRGAGGIMRARIRNGAGANDIIVDSTSAIDNSRWHHIAFVSNTSADQYQLFIDGRLEAAANNAHTGTVQTANSVDFFGATRDLNGAFDATIDGFRIWNDTMTPADLFYIQPQPTVTVGAEASAPTTTLNTPQLNLLEWGAFYDLRIRLNVTVPSGETISTCWLNGSTTISNRTITDTNMCSLDIANTLTNSLIFYANSSANTTSALLNITFALSNATQNQTAAFPHNMSLQTIQINNTINFTGGSAWDFAINYSVVFPRITNLSAANQTGSTSATANATSFINWSADWITNSGLQNETAFENRSRSHTMSSQFVINQTNISITNHANVTFTNINLTLPATCNNNVTLSSLSNYTTITQNNCTWTEFNSDNLGDVEGTQRNFQNRSAAVHNQTAQQYINETHLNATNAWGFSFLNVSWTANCEGASVNGTVGIGSPQLTANCSWVVGSVDIVNESRARYNVTDDDIRINTNSSGYAEIRIQLLNLTGFNFMDLINLTINATPLFSSGWINATGITENYTININITQINLRNITINRTSSILTNVTVLTSECPSGVTYMGGNITCRNESTYLLSSVNYTLRTTIAQFNLSDTITATFPLVVAWDISYFPDFATRETELATEGYINSSRVNTTVLSNSTHVIISIGTSHTTSSLTPTGTYVAKIVYSVRAGGGSGGLGTTGSGGAGNLPPKPLEEVVTEEAKKVVAVTTKALESPVVKVELAFIGLTFVGVYVATRNKNKGSILKHLR